MNLHHTKTYLLVHVILAIFLLLCFRAGLDNFFAGDDFNWLFITAKTIQHPLYFFQSHAFFAEAHNNYIRFTELAYFILNMLVAGVNPVSYQLSALALHIMSTLLVSLFISHLCKNHLAGLIGALFWGLNYKHVEIVFRPYGVADSLVVIFCLGAFLLFFHQRDLLALVCFLAGLFAKENALVFPVLLGGYGVLFQQRPLKKWFVRTIPFWSMSLMFAVLVRFMGAKGYLSIDFAAMSRFWENMLSYVGPDAIYVKIVWLHGQPNLFPIWLSTLLFMLLGIILWKLPNLYKFSILWMIIMMLPTLFVPFQTSRYHYVPLIGLALLVGNGLAHLIEHFQQRHASHAVAGLILAFTLLLIYFILGVNLEEQDYAFYGEIHREAAESFQQTIIPNMPKDAHSMAVFFKQDSTQWTEMLYQKFLLKPWYMPGTYKWVYRRPVEILGLSNTYAFVTYCTYNEVKNTLFVNVPYEEYRRNLLTDNFYLILHDYNTNSFKFGPETLTSQITEKVDDRNFYHFLQPGRFDPTNTGSLFF